MELLLQHGAFSKAGTRSCPGLEERQNHSARRNRGRGRAHGKAALFQAQKVFSMLKGLFQLFGGLGRVFQKVKDCFCRLGR